MMMTCIDTYETLDQLPLGIFVLDANYTVLFWNQRLEEWTDQHRDAIIGQRLADHYPHLLEPRYTTRLDGIFSGGPPAVFSSQLHHHIIPAPQWNGKMRVQHTTVTPLLDDSGEYHALFAIQDVTDLTDHINQALTEVRERQHAEAQLRKSEGELRALLAAITDLIIVVDRDGVFQQVIPTNSRIALPESLGALVHRPLDTVLSKKQTAHIMQGVTTALDIQQPASVECEILGAWYALTFSPMEGDRAICTVRDITEKKEAEKQAVQLLIEQENRAILASFVQSASHDFRTPLSVLNTSIHLLRQAQDPDARERRLDRLQQQVDHMSRLVESLFEVSRINTLHEMDFQRMDLRDLLRDLEPDMRQRSDQCGLEFSIVLTDQTIPVYVDAQRLTQALRAIVENAITFTQAGSVTICLERNGGAASVHVEDTGIGIHTENLPHIFDVFYKVDQARSSHLGGLGLGLFLARRIVDLHQGQVAIDSTPGVGTCATVTLPIQAAP
jgi:PAS domain S-box-containing protein